MEEVVLLEAKIAASDALPATVCTRGMIDLTAKSSETTSDTNLDRSPRRIPRPLEEGRYRATEGFESCVRLEGFCDRSKNLTFNA
jgi:hypothetical protein